jgi:acyl-coenzyme A synthetase/AMP-(fatty) acid ligase
LYRHLTTVLAIALLLAITVSACGRLSEEDYKRRVNDAIAGVASASTELESAAREASNGKQFLLVVTVAGKRATKSIIEMQHLSAPQSEEASKAKLVAALIDYKHVLQKGIAAARRGDRAQFAEVTKGLSANDPAVRTIRQEAARVAP